MNYYFAMCQQKSKQIKKTVQFTTVSKEETVTINQNKMVKDNYNENIKTYLKEAQDAERG